jgi:hypothetical protein
MHLSWSSAQGKCICNLCYLTLIFHLALFAVELDVCAQRCVHANCRKDAIKEQPAFRVRSATPATMQKLYEVPLHQQQYHCHRTTQTLFLDASRATNRKQHKMALLASVVMPLNASEEICELCTSVSLGLTFMFPTSL